MSRGSGNAAGYLAYAAAGTLRAVPFDPVRFEVLGDPVTVVERVTTKATGAANYAVSRAGALVYLVGAGEQTTPRSLVWVDRKGREEPIGAPLRAYGTPRLSPDGTRVAVEVYDQNADIWIWDLARETRSGASRSIRRAKGCPSGRLTASRSSTCPTRSGVSNVYRQAADGSGTVDRLVTSAIPQWPTSITPDGRSLVGFDLLPRTTSDIASFSA